MVKEKTKMYLIVLLFILINTNNASSTTDCTKYERKVSVDIKTGYRKFVNCLGYDVESSRADLIIMLDRSGSMTWYSSDVDGVTMNGYEIAKKFIKDLLSEVKISFNATRIAVVTFGSEPQENINFLLNPVPVNNKCEFDKKFKKLPRAGGGTNMSGAIKMGFNILSKSGRSKINRVGILLSDGYPNNPSLVTSEAIKFKSMGAIMYTVAVDGADMISMRNWATNRNNEPNPPTAIHATTFKDMARLANNIRGGKQYFYFLSYN